MSLSRLSPSRPTGALLRPPAIAAIAAPTDLLTPALAAERLSVSPKVLERWRGAGGGPTFVKLSRKTIRYRPSDLTVFIAGCARENTAIT